MLQPLTGLHIASQLDPAHYEVRLHHEDWHGPLHPRACERFDLVFLAGLHADFDRMRQLSYHFGRRGASVIAGGNFCTMFPEFASRYFDAVCVGGVECVHEVVADFERGALRRIYRSPQTRTAHHRVDYSIFERAGIRPPVHLIETSRGCNFRCRFCVIPAEGARHAPYALDAVEAAIANAMAATPWHSLRRLYPAIWFLDNNFSDSRDHLFEMCRRLSAIRQLKGWGALVTQNTLADRQLIAHMARHKCRTLFVGVESLDAAFLRRQNKKQNLGRMGGVVDDILSAERLGILITYAYLFDPRIATVDDMSRQIRALVGARSLPMPAFFSMLVPLVGTGDFWDSAQRGELRPNLRLRDLDGETICYAKVADDPDRLGGFVRLLSTHPAKLIDPWRLLVSTLCRIGNLRGFNPVFWAIVAASNFRVFSFARRYDRTLPRTYMGGIDALDAQYRECPPGLSDEDRERYFDPIMVTDAHGALADWLRPYAAVAGQQAAAGAVRVEETL